MDKSTEGFYFLKNRPNRPKYGRRAVSSFSGSSRSHFRSSRDARESVGFPWHFKMASIVFSRASRLPVKGHLTSRDKSSPTRNWEFSPMDVTSSAFAVSKGEAPNACSCFFLFIPSKRASKDSTPTLNLESDSSNSSKDKVELRFEEFAPRSPPSSRRLLWDGSRFRPTEGACSLSYGAKEGPAGGVSGKGGISRRVSRPSKCPTTRVGVVSTTPSGSGLEVISMISPALCSSSPSQ